MELNDFVELELELFEIDRESENIGACVRV